MASTTNETKTNVIKSTSLTRITKIPLVKTYLDLLFVIYTTIKTRNELNKLVLNKSENHLFTIVSLSLPIISLFRKPIGIADNLANNFLDKIEARFPILFKLSPPEIYKKLISTYKSYKNWIINYPSTFKQNRLNDLNKLKEYIIERIDLILKFAILHSLSKIYYDLLTTIDRLIDEYLPPTEEELRTLKKEDQLSLFGFITKVRRRY